MGVMTFITLEREIPDLEDKLGGKALAWYQLRLDTRARRLGLKPLSDFLSMDAEQAADLMAEFGPAEGQDVGLPEEEWFDAADGLETVRGLLSYFHDNPRALQRVECPEALLDDLVEAEKILVEARHHGVRFHLTAAY
jgi:hypothetical protein